MAETLPGEFWDVLVIGAGPAGALASLDLARRGLRVLLVEKRRFPRWKVCGACFNGQAQAALASVGQGHLLESLGGLPLRRLRLGLGGRQTSCALPPGWAVSPSR
ncbi:FAD-dependent oxidoreductase, partial [Synechococcus sp. BA-124 BA4]|uniref:FAD-dependent oxidoreductase n=1 Tax=Synechococcus sp. BA-124 BA4 TaxID=3110251 RepID=UPI002B1F32D2